MAHTHTKKKEATSCTLDGWLIAANVSIVIYSNELESNSFCKCLAKTIVLTSIFSSLTLSARAHARTTANICYIAAHLFDFATQRNILIHFHHSIALSNAMVNTLAK